jgi:uncharacterized protein (DUF1684 family)
MTDDRPGRSDQDPRAILSLLDYRRRVADLYAEVRSVGPRGGHEVWCAGRDRLFATHPDSPVPAAERPDFDGLPVFPYDESLRFEVGLAPLQRPRRIALQHSRDGTTQAIAIGRAELDIDEDHHALTVYWLDQYGGGVFLPFGDATNGVETYGGGRYLLDSAKGADLGSRDDNIVLDFNFAYHPSCVHDVRWSCPLAPPENRLGLPIRAGERLGGDST